MQTRKRARELAQQQTQRQEEKKSENQLQRINPVLGNILSLLRLRDAANLAKADRFCRALINRTSTWLILHRTHYGPPPHRGTFKISYEDYKAQCQAQVLLQQVDSSYGWNRLVPVSKLETLVEEHKNQPWTHYYLAQLNQYDGKEIQHAFNALRAGDLRALDFLTTRTLDALNADRKISQQHLDEFLKILSEAGDMMEAIDIERYTCLIYCIKASLTVNFDDKVAFKEKAIALFFQSLTPECTQIREFIKFGLNFLRALRIDLSLVPSFNLSNRSLLNAPNLMEGFVVDNEVYKKLSRIDHLLHQKFIAWLKAAINNGNPAAMVCYAHNELNSLNDPDGKIEKSFYIKAAEAGHFRGIIGLFVLFREEGTVSREEIAKYTKPLALKGNKDAVAALIVNNTWKKDAEQIWIIMVHILRCEEAKDVYKELLRCKQRIDSIPLFIRCALTFVHAMKAPVNYAEAQEQYTFATIGKADIFTQFLQVGKTLNIDISPFEAVLHDLEKEANHKHKRTARKKR